MNSGAAFKELCDIVEKLRGEGGCPWDREQSPHTLRGDLIEETYECVEAIDEKDPSHIREELGDLFLLATMISYMHEQMGLFSVADVLSGISAKLIRRHPHVFGQTSPRGLTPAEAGTSAPGLTPAEVGTSASGLTPAEVGTSASGLSSAEVLANWARIKVEQEGRKPKDSVLDEVSRSLPPLDRAWKLQKKAAKQGFDWPDVKGIFDKLQEETGEIKEAAKAAASLAEDTDKPDTTGKLEEELGDLLFSAVNLCRFFGVEPSIALQRANAKFTKRFKYIETKMKQEGLPMEAANLALMDRYWTEAKHHLL
ncbi:MAG: nucleoside triphosphate pyrophosphohydrolase [Spirochaetaceae bacterium]|jgi:tetrapyrrole methylase family protein/MazG family protein|nr:nucleoside triphosphate pyrophosphohydrolase [Spirochaetaceae bacterium]